MGEQILDSQENLNNRIVWESEYELSIEKETIASQYGFINLPKGTSSRVEHKVSSNHVRESNSELIQLWTKSERIEDASASENVNKKRRTTSFKNNENDLENDVEQQLRFNDQQTCKFEAYDFRRMLLSTPTSFLNPDDPRNNDESPTCIQNSITRPTASLSIFKRVPLNRTFKQFGVWDESKEGGFFVEFRRERTMTIPDETPEERPSNRIYPSDHIVEVSPEHVRPLIVILWCGAYCLVSVLQHLYYNFFKSYDVPEL